MRAGWIAEINARQDALTAYQAQAAFSHLVGQISMAEEMGISIKVENAVRAALDFGESQPKHPFAAEESS